MGTVDDQSTIAGQDHGIEQQRRLAPEPQLELRQIAGGEEEEPLWALVGHPEIAVIVEHPEKVVLLQGQKRPVDQGGLGLDIIIFGRRRLLNAGEFVHAGTARSRGKAGHVGSARRRVSAARWRRWRPALYLASAHRTTPP